MVKCQGRDELARKLTDKTVKPIVDKHHELESRLSHKSDLTDEEIEAEFADYGTVQQDKQGE